MPELRDAAARFSEISFVDLEADEVFDAAILGGNGGISNPRKRIEDRLHAGDAMKFDAAFGQLHWERGRMWPLLFAALDCLVRNEPGVAAAACVASAGVGPARDVALVLIRDAERETVDVDLAFAGEMKHEFMEVVHKLF